MARSELVKRAVREVALALQQQRVTPDLPIAGEQPLLLSHRVIARDLVGIDARPQFAELRRQGSFETHRTLLAPRAGNNIARSRARFRCDKKRARKGSMAIPIDNAVRYAA